MAWLSAAGALGPRVASALIMGPVTILAVVLGWPWFDLFVAVGAAVLAWEWSTVCCGRPGPMGWALAVVVSLAALLVAPWQGWALLLPVAGAVAAIVLFGVGWRRSLWIAVGCLYIGLPVVCLVWVRMETGWEVLVWLFLVVWATDIGAYGFGRWIGGPRLWPAVSPNKTWAGFVGGIGCAAVVGLAGALGLAGGLEGRDAWVLALLALLLGIVSQGGDLFESAFKRRFRVKDSSDLIPGHGGLLDRVDGLIAATPLMAVAVLLEQGGITRW